MKTWRKQAPNGDTYEVEADQEPSAEKWAALFAEVGAVDEQKPKRELPVMTARGPAGMRPASEEEYQRYQADLETGGKQLTAGAMTAAAPLVMTGVAGAGLLGPTMRAGARVLMGTGAAGHGYSAVKELGRGNLVGAARDAGIAAALATGASPGLVGRMGALLTRMARGRTAATTAVEAAGPSLESSMASKLAEIRAMRVRQANIQAQLKAKVSEVGPAPATVTSVASPTVREVADKAAAVMRFGKEAAARNPKVGEKIWVLLDEAGTPLKVLTPDQAGAAARAGKPTTWIKNMWRR